MTQTDVILHIATANTRLLIGISGIIAGLLPKDEIYKMEVLLEAHNDTLRETVVQLKKEKKK